MFLFGLVLTYGFVGSFVVEYVAEVITAEALWSNYLCMSWTSSLIGLLVKVYSFPVNYGVLNILESVPLGVLFLLVVVTQFFVIVVLSLGGVCMKLTLVFCLCGVMSLILGFIGGIVEAGIARCLGYTSVGNSGALMLGLGCGSEIFNSYVILWSLCYSMGLFLFGVVYCCTVSYVPSVAVCSLVRLDELCGLSITDCLLGLGISCALICLMGLTFTLGLLFKYYYWLVSSLCLTAVLVLLSAFGILSSVSYWRWLERVLFGVPSVVFRICLYTLIETCWWALACMVWLCS